MTRKSTTPSNPGIASRTSNGFFCQWRRKKDEADNQPSNGIFTTAILSLSVNCGAGIDNRIFEIG